MRVDLIIFFLFSFFVSSYYTEADQFHYIKNYEDMRNADLLFAFNMYRGNLSSSEPIYFLLSFLFSNIGISKIMFCTISNCILYNTLKKYFQLVKLNKFLIYLILFTNFYLLVLYFSDDRLKFAFLFLILWYLSNSNFKFLYLFLSIGSHVQVLLTLFSILLVKFGKMLSKSFLRVTFQILIGVITITYLYDHIYTKAEIYIGQFADRDNLLQYIKFLIFFLLTFLLTKKIRTVIIAFTPLFFALILFGPTRVNMLGYLVMMYFGVSNNRGLNFPVLSTSFYLGLKGIIFYFGILFLGDGFGYDVNVMQYFFS